MDYQEHMTLTKGALAEIQTLTNTLGGDPTIDEIDEALRKRDALVCMMKNNVSHLDGNDAGWSVRAAKDPATKRLFEESNALLHSIGEMDRRLASCIESRMAGIQKQLSFVYSASRAAHSYTAHSSLRAAI
jgi:hypothetical protein